MRIAQSANVGRNIQLTLELVVVQVELGQIDEVAELLGQFSCKTSENVSKIDNTYVCWDIQLELATRLGMHCR